MTRAKRRTHFHSGSVREELITRGERVVSILSFLYRYGSFGKVTKSSTTQNKKSLSRRLSFGPVPFFNPLIGCELQICRIEKEFPPLILFQGSPHA